MATKFGQKLAKITQNSLLRKKPRTFSH